VLVAPEMTADHTAAIAEAISVTLHEQVEGLEEVEVHFAPQPVSEPSYALAARAQADALGLATHEVHISNGEQGKVLEMHVEVPPGQTLGDAHQHVTQLEDAVRRSLPDVDEVITHIEPAQIDPTDADIETLPHREIKAQALNLLRDAYPDADWHHLRVYSGTNGAALTMHTTLPPEVTVEEAHRLSEEAETLLRANMPQLERVTIHTEPPDLPD